MAVFFVVAMIVIEQWRAHEQYRCLSPSSDPQQPIESDQEERRRKKMAGQKISSTIEMKKRDGDTENHFYPPSSGG